MQVAIPSPSPARMDGLGSIEVPASPSTPSQRRLRRSLRLSGAALLSPQQALNKENVGISPLNQPSTSAKTLDIGASDSDKLSSPRLSSPLSSSSPLNTSPLRSKSSPVRNRSPLRRALHSRSDEPLSSSDESDDSTLVFFGKPSSAEKKKRIHYEQRVLEKRLKHKDSLDLARRRPISFNPDDTMLIDDQHAHGWSWSKPTPTPLRSTKLLLSSPLRPHDSPASPTISRASTRNSSPAPLVLQQEPHAEEQAAPGLHSSNVQDRQTPSLPNLSHDDLATSPVPPTQAGEGMSRDKGEHKDTQPQVVTIEKEQVNPFIAAQSSPSKASPTKSGPSKQNTESPRRNQSPVRSVETLIGATMAHNRDLVSPMRSPRRSPRLSLRALQLSASPTKLGSNVPPLSTPFQQPLPLQQATPHHHSTPFQQPATAPSVPPSTGLSRFACLQNLSAINARVPETPANRALSMRLAHPSVLPSPFISTGLFDVPSVGPAAVSRLETPSRSPSRKMQASSPTKQVQFAEQAYEAQSMAKSTSPSKAAPTPGTPSSRFAAPLLLETPSKSVQLSARSPSPTKARLIVDDARSPDRMPPVSQHSASPQLQSNSVATALPSTPPPSKAEAKPETPGPVFRQTARRVPIHQHEAEFGVKVSPEKPSYSPRRAYANSSARTNDYSVMQERIPARRVPVQPSAAVRQASAKQGDGPASSAVRVASVASKAARTVSSGSSRIGGQTTSLPAAALARAASSAQPSSSASSAVTSQAAARTVSSSLGSSVASKASRLQRPASVAFGTKPNSPSKQARSLSGLPRPRSAQSTSTSAPASGPGSRLPRPATFGPSASQTKPASRPVPMAIARLAPAQQSRAQLSAASARIHTVATPVGSDSSSPEASPASEASTLSPDSAVPVKDAVEGSPEVTAAAANAEPLATTQRAAAPARQATSGASASELRRPASASALRSAPREADTKSQPEMTAQTHQIKTAKTIATTEEGDSTRSSSPVVPAAPAKPVSSARSAPPVVLDPEQQRLRCLAMQEKARNRTPKGSSSTSVTASSDMEEPPSSDGSPLASTAEPAAVASAGPSSAPSAAEALAAKHAEIVDSTTANAASGGSTTGCGSSTASTATSTGRPLRSSRLASRPLAASATRVPPSRGRALSLNDIIAARKIDVPLSLADQLKLADTVNKKHNEKTLARYKITKIQRPYERPPSPERHDHEPEACTIIDDLSRHRQGKGDVAPYSTPPKSSASYAPGAGRKSVRWYRPLFVGQGAQYGTRACESKPALKPIYYELDRMGNKVPTGTSPKLSKGQSIVIYRNYFQGESEPADD